MRNNTSRAILSQSRWPAGFLGAPTGSVGLFASTTTTFVAFDQSGRLCVRRLINTGPKTKTISTRESHTRAYESRGSVPILWIYGVRARVFRLTIPWERRSSLTVAAAIATHRRPTRILKKTGETKKKTGIQKTKIG